MPDVELQLGVFSAEFQSCFGPFFSCYFPILSIWNRIFTLRQLYIGSIQPIFYFIRTQRYLEQC